jgi:hypothetical protein
MPSALRANWTSASTISRRYSTTSRRGPQVPPVALGQLSDRPARSILSQILLLISEHCQHRGRGMTEHALRRASAYRIEEAVVTGGRMSISLSYWLRVARSTLFVHPLPTLCRCHLSNHSFWLGITTLLNLRNASSKRHRTRNSETAGDRNRGSKNRLTFRDLNPSIMTSH